jgi:hypothetical protein
VNRLIWSTGRPVSNTGPICPGVDCKMGRATTVDSAVRYESA